MGNCILDWIMEHVFPWLIIVFGVFVVLIIPVMFVCAYQESKNPFIQIKKEEWVCMQYKSSTYTTMMPVGKVIVPMVHTTNTCVQYNRK